MNRRELLSTTAILPVGLALASCSLLQSAVEELPQWAKDIHNLAVSLGKVSSAISNLAGLPVDAAKKVQDWIADAQSVADKISAAAKNGGDAKSLVTNFADIFGKIMVTLWPGSGTLKTVLEAGVSILPTVLKLAGVMLFAPAAPESLIPATPLPYADASAILAGLAAR